MSEQVFISIAGSGSATKVLLSTPTSNNIRFNSIWARNESKAKALAAEFDLNLIADPSAFNQSDALIVAVSDNSIKEVAEKFSNFNGLLMHLSGATPIEHLGNKRNAVIWPIQSLNINNAKLNVPFGYECHPEDENLVISIIESFGGKAVRMDYNTRSHLHMVAVFCNNFTNFIMTVADDLLDNKDQLKLFLPMLQQSLENWKTRSPKDLQTGPAIRRDEATIKEHLDRLKHSSIATELYSKLTTMIQEYHDKL